MDKPVYNYDFLHEAEEYLAGKLAEWLELRKGVDLYVSTNGGRTECAVFDIGHIETGDQNTYPAGKWHFRSKLDLYSRNRKTIQRWYGMLMLTLPISPWQGRSNAFAEDGSSLVQTFRIAPQSGSPSEITTVTLVEGNARTGVECFTGSVEFDTIISVLGE